MLGYNIDGQQPWTQNQDERISPQSFHITSDLDVTIFALSQAHYTADAFLVLPTDVLREDYFIMSYNSDGSFGGNGRTPSEFALIAVQDSSQITIIPTTQTYVNGNVIQNITLNKGDVFLVQAKITTTSSFSDLTGSELHSDKPIAVFSGHQRATLPINTYTNNASRDCLIQQIPPVKTWGKSAFLIPYIHPSGIDTNGNDLFRILAAYDSTDVFIDGVKIITLNKGGFYEGALIKASKVTASRPILVAQFKKTSNDGGLNNYMVGDPFMMIIPSQEQFLNHYRIINVQAYESGINSIPEYTDQYIGIIAPDTSLYSVTVDASVVNPASFSAISNSGYSYANVKVTDGVHEVRANGGIGVLVYGYGPALSYGYPGGMSFQSLNPSSVEDITTYEENISLYPNPSFSGSDINIRIPKNINNLKISLYNSLGSLLDTHIEDNISLGQHTISYKPGVELYSGIYWLRVETGRESWCKPIIVIKN